MSITSKRPSILLVVLLTSTASIIFAILLSNSPRLTTTLPRLRHHLHSAPTTTMANLTLTKRPSDTRGHADHDWLKTYHHFSFASWFDPRYQNLGALRVINEDRVARGYGFDTHPHREFEIFSYVVSGTLEHDDSLKNTEVLKRGDVQMTSAGTGVRHSEHNRRGKVDTHFLQIWALPNERNLEPKYYTRHFSDEEKTDKIVKIVAPLSDSDVIDKRLSEGPAPVHGNLRAFATLLSPSSTLSHTLQASTKRALVHNIMTSGYRNPRQKVIEGGSKVQVGAAGGEGVTLEEGDSVVVEVKKVGGEGEGRLELRGRGEGRSELLIFEMSD